jgi:hypothetical protein
MVTVMQDGSRRVIAAVDEAARAQRLHPGMTAAHAQSLIPNLFLADATPDDDDAALMRLGLWCTRYSPLVMPDPPDGVFIDVAGSAHLFKGEAALLADLTARLAKDAFTARAAVADTPGCAWALARFGQGGIVAPGRAADVLGGLRVAALRLPSHIVQSLADVGIERVAQLATKPRSIVAPVDADAVTSGMIANSLTGQPTIASAQRRLDLREARYRPLMLARSYQAGRDERSACTSHDHLLQRSLKLLRLMRLHRTSMHRLVVVHVMMMAVMMLPMVPVMAVHPMMMVAMLPVVPVMAVAIALARHRLVGDFLGDQRLLDRRLGHVRRDRGRGQQARREQRG